MTSEKVDRQTEIKNAAAQLFIDAGFDGASMERIAKESGVSKRTPYLYFETKHDLFSCIVRDVLLSIEITVSEAFDGEGDALARIRRAALAYASYAFENPKAFGLVMTFERQHYFPGRRDMKSGYADECVRINDRITARLHDLVEEAMRDRALSTRLSVSQFSLMFWASLAGVIVIALDRRNVLASRYGWEARPMIESFLDHVLPSGEGA